MNTPTPNCNLDVDDFALILAEIDAKQRESDRKLLERLPALEMRPEWKLNDRGLIQTDDGDFEPARLAESQYVISMGYAPDDITSASRLAALFQAGFRVIFFSGLPVSNEDTVAEFDRLFTSHGVGMGNACRFLLEIRGVE
jgi:hypothetical protein